jgi:hypothetical protein
LLGAFSGRQGRKIVYFFFQSFFVNKSVEQRNGFVGIAAVCAIVGGTRSRGTVAEQREQGEKKRRKHTTAQSTPCVHPRQKTDYPESGR